MPGLAAATRRQTRARVPETLPEVVREEAIEDGVDGGVGVLQAAGGQDQDHRARGGHQVYKHGAMIQDDPASILHTLRPEHDDHLCSPVREPAEEVDGEDGEDESGHLDHHISWAL